MTEQERVRNIVKNFLADAERRIIDAIENPRTQAVEGSGEQQKEV